MMSAPCLYPYGKTAVILHREKSPIDPMPIPGGKEKMVW